MQGWLKGQSHILKIAIMVPRRRLSRAIAATFWPRGRRALRARRPRGPNVKKYFTLLGFDPHKYDKWGNDYPWLKHTMIIFLHHKIVTYA